MVDADYQTANNTFLKGKEGPGASLLPSVLIIKHSLICQSRGMFNVTFSL